MTVGIVVLEAQLRNGGLASGQDDIADSAQGARLTGVLGKVLAAANMHDGEITHGHLPATGMPALSHPVSVSSGWGLLPPSIAASLSPLSFDLERRVLNHYPRRELPMSLQSTAYTWSQVRASRRLYAQTRHEQPTGLFDD